MDARTRPIRRLLHCLVSATLYAVLLATTQAQPVKEPAPGILLVAAESMADPRFRQTVLLIIEHDQTGSWGLVINRPTEVEVGEMLPALKEPANPSKVYFGGPVQLDRLMFLYRDGSDPGNGATGLPGVRWSDSEQLLEEKMARHPARVRVFAGYAGWAPGQLRFELARGGWRMVQGRPADVFSDDPEQLWRRLTDVLGGIAI